MFVYISWLQNIQRVLRDSIIYLIQMKSIFYFLYMFLNEQYTVSWLNAKKLKYTCVPTHITSEIGDVTLMIAVSLVIKRNTNRCRYTYFFSIFTRIETCNLVFDTYIKLPNQQGKYIFEGVFFYIFFLLSEMGVNRLDWATVVKKMLPPPHFGWCKMKFL